MTRLPVDPQPKLGVLAKAPTRQGEQGVTHPRPWVGDTGSQRSSGMVKDERKRQAKEKDSQRTIY